MTKLEDLWVGSYVKVKPSHPFYGTAGLIGNIECFYGYTCCLVNFYFPVEGFDEETHEQFIADRWFIPIEHLDLSDFTPLKEKELTC